MREDVQTLEKRMQPVERASELTGIEGGSCGPFTSDPALTFTARDPGLGWELGTLRVDPTPDDLDCE